MRFEIAAQSIKGGRSYQEDTWTVRGLDGRDLVEEASSAQGAMAREALVVVADGMGGEGGGGEASDIVAGRFNETFFAEATLGPAERLQAALDEANAALLAAKQRRPELKEKSGSTLIAGIVQDKGLHFLSVGDSSIWRFRDEEIHRINILHERAPELDVRAAELDTDQAWDHVLSDPQRYSITAAVMGFAIEPQHRQIAARAIQPGDVLVFASDGIETLTAEHLRRAVTTILPKRNAAGLASALVKMIQRLGTKEQDNTTVVVVRALPDADRTQILPPANGQGASVPSTRIAQPRPAAPNASPAPSPAAPSPAAPQRPNPAGGRPRLPFDTLTATAAAIAVAIVLYVAYVLMWPAPRQQENGGAAARRGGSGSAALGVPESPASSSSAPASTQLPAKDPGQKQKGHPGSGKGLGRTQGGSAEFGHDPGQGPYLNDPHGRPQGGPESGHDPGQGPYSNAPTYGGSQGGVGESGSEQGYSDDPPQSHYPKQ